MKFGGNISIRNKIILMVLASTIPALFLASGIFLYNDFKLIKKDMLKNLKILGNVVGANSRSALIFNDVTSASTYLSSLQTEKQIVYAAIIDQNGQKFATYTSTKWPKFKAPDLQGLSPIITKDYITMVLPIRFEGNEIGKIYLHAELQEFKIRQRNILYLTGFTFVGVLVVAFIVAINLQGIISKPILKLAKIATSISQNRDYSHRVSYEGDDEIGKLYSGFNEMLLQIENRDNELEIYGQNLENKIVESNQLTEKLAISEARFRQVILDAPIPIMIHDDKGDVLMISRMWTEITGYNQSELSTLSNWANRAYPENTSFVLERIRKVFADNAFINKGEFEITIFDGTKRIWHFYSKSFSDKVDGRTYAVSMAMDITERKQMEMDLAESQNRLLHAEKLSATGNLSASIAHEFNNPIYGIRNVLEMISDEVPLGEAHQEFVSLAIKECNRMKGLILKLQDLYRPTSGIIELLNIHEVIDETLLWIQKSFINKHIVLEKHYTKDLPEISGVSDQLKQVILNLLQNAEEAISNNGGKIIIHTELFSSFIRIGIHDSGVGIDPNIIKNIFNPFFTTKSKVKGTGLGLSVSYGIVRAHGGDIQVISEPGSGTNFIISLPIKRIENNVE